MEKTPNLAILNFSWNITAPFFSKWLRLKGIQECVQQEICHSQSTPRCILLGEMGIYTGILPSVFCQFYFLAVERMEFLKRRSTFLKQVTDKNKDTFLGYEK